MTLGQLYEKTGKKYKLRLLAGSEGLGKTVGRIYYFEDLSISDWTRDGELLITTAMMTTREPDWMMRFVKSVQYFHPSGIFVNTGGYLEEIPKDVIAYCDEIGLPLFSFPWEIILQDIITELTTMLFETEQLENNISRAFLNAIFYPEEKEEYEICLEKNGISQYDRFTVAVISITRDHEIREHFSQRVRSRMGKCMLLEHEQEMICVFYDTKISLIKEQMKMLLRTWHIHYPQAPVRFYLGVETDTCYALSNSYEKAKICQKIGKRKNQNFLTFDELGVLGILASSEADLMEAHYQAKLKPLIDHDANNDTDYTETLECYIESGCNVSEVAQKLFIHRNTVNYRLRKIREITGDDMTDVGILVDYKLAFLIRCLL